MAVCRVEMPAGTKHYEVLADIAEAMGDDVFDDRGVPEAIERLGKASRLYGREAIRHLRDLLYASERVLELGQGLYDRKQGLVVLTNERLFFFGKSLSSETVEQFSLSSIQALVVNKKRTGENFGRTCLGRQGRDHWYDARSSRRYCSSLPQPETDGPDYGISNRPSAFI
jgi:hypothetical protein